MSKVANIRRTVLAVKGVNKGGKRGIDVTVSGELDVKAGGNSVAFDFDVEVKKQAGKPDQIKFIGRSEPGKSVTINMIEKVKLENLSIIVLRQGSGWGWQLTGQAPFRSKRRTINLENSPSNRKSLSFGTGGLTLAEIAGVPNLPVLGGIKVGWIVATKINMRLDMTIKGIGAEVMLYKPNGSSKYHAGFAMGDFSPTDFIPDTSNTPLKDVTFKGLVFIYNPTRAVENTTLNKLPLIFASRMPQSPNNVAINPGLNVFGHLDVHPTGELANLLKYIGITDLSLPLNGGLSPKVFSKNISGTAIKNAILDNLDINVNLPKLNFSGIPKTVSFNKTHLEIKGTKDKNNQRAIDVDVRGELDVSIKNQKVAFDYDVDIKKPSGKPAEVVITGSTAPGKKVSIDMLHKFTLDGLQLHMTKEKGGWLTKVKASSEFRSKPISLSYVHPPPGVTALTDGSNYLDIETKLTLAEIIGHSNLPGLDDVEVNWIQVYSGYWRVNLNVKGLNAYVNIFRPTGKTQYLVGFGVGDVAPVKFIPGTENTPLKDVSFKAMSFVYAPKALGGRLYRDQMPSPDFSNPLMHRGGESRKMAIRQSLTAIPERPRCKQSVAQHCSNLNRLNGTRLWPGSMAESSHRMPEGCCWGGWIAASG